MTVTFPVSAWARVPAKIRNSDRANSQTVRRREATGPSRYLRAHCAAVSGLGTGGAAAGAGTAGGGAGGWGGVVVIWLTAALPSRRWAQGRALAPRVPVRSRSERTTLA